VTDPIRRAVAIVLGVLGTIVVPVVFAIVAVASRRIAL
jgi:hypothetical protein